MQSAPRPLRDDDPERSEKEKMLAGELYLVEGELIADLQRTREWMARYNAAVAKPSAVRRAMLRELFAFVGEGAAIRPPFHCDYGCNISLGAGAFMNFNCVVLDVVSVSIGERTQIGAAVHLITADHPRDAATRATMLEFSRPVVIGADVWIGSGAMILPGVRVGDGAIVGAGAVVTRDVTPGVTVAGNPARPLHR